MASKSAGRTFAVLLCVLVCRCTPWVAAQGLTTEDYSFERLQLEANRTVTTWKEDGVRVFIAPQGAVIRQGDLRLSAPRLVAWFEVTPVRPGGPLQAVVSVYAEGLGKVEQKPARAVRLAEGKEARTCAAVFMRFTSRAAFQWQCPLRKLEERTYSGTLARAEAVVRGLTEDKVWDVIPLAQDIEAPPVVPYQLDAHQLHEFKDNTIVFVGDVHGSYGNMTVRADAAVVWFDPEARQYEIYAEGNVRLSKEEGAGPGPTVSGMSAEIEMLAAEQLYINPRRGRSLAIDAELRMRHPVRGVYVVRGKKAFVVDPNTLAIEDASMTSCEFARPHYSFKAARAEVIRQGAATPLFARDVWLKAGDTGLLWLPLVATDLSQPSFLLSRIGFGSSQKFGTFFLTTWRPQDLMPGDVEWIDDWELYVDYYSDRGTAFGTELDYEFDSGRHDGRIRWYSISDQADEDDTGKPVPRTDRGRFHVEHRSCLTPSLRADAEYYWLSDAAFLKEYFENDAREEKDPETYALLRYLRNSTYVGLLYKEQVNDFLTQVTAKPELVVRVIGLPVGRLVYEGELRTGRYDLEYDDEMKSPPPEPPELTRTHTEHKLSLPFSWGIFRLDPFIRAVATWASKGEEAPGTFAGSVHRGMTGAGFNASTTLSRTFGLRSTLLDLNMLRHIMIPYMRYEKVSASGDKSPEFIQMDLVDALDTSKTTTFGLRNRVQTKRLRGEKWVSVDWMEFDIAYVEGTSDSVMASLDQDFVRTDFEWRTTEHFHLHSRDNRIAVGSGADIINAGMKLDYSPGWVASLDYDRRTDTNSTLTGKLTWPLSDRYELILYEQYELDSRGAGQSTNLDTQVIIRRFLHKWVLDLGLRIDESNDETAILFGFGPVGWGTFSGVRWPGR